METPALETFTSYLPAQAAQAWKAQLDTALKLVEALTEGAMKMHETQLEAATDAHANAEATRQSAAGAAGPAELAKIGSQWMQHNAEHAAAYWRALFEAALETNASLLKCLGEAGAALGAAAAPGAAGVAPLDVEASKNALLGAVDGAYKQWLEATRRLYGTPVE